MTYTPDLIVQDQDGRQIAWIEVKRNPPSSRFAAAAYYGRVKDDLERAGVRFFMLVTSKTMHLWDRDRAPITDDLATMEGISENIPSFLVERSDTEHKARALEYAVFNWLLDFVVQEERHNDPAEQLLRQSGFLAALKNAELRFGGAA